jgi:hypothetical protein
MLRGMAAAALSHGHRDGRRMAGKDGCLTRKGDFDTPGRGFPTMSEGA